MTEARKYQAYYTKSTPIVDYMVQCLTLEKTDYIFEPCGGDGVFVEAILDENEYARIDVCELNPAAVEQLTDKFSEYPSVCIRACDTLLDGELSFNSQMGGRYDKIIANPPYGAWQDYDKRGVLKRMYPELYAKETYGLFLYRCIELLKEDGLLCFIIPDTFLNLHMHRALREHILAKTQVVELALFPSSFFPGVSFGYANLSIVTLRKCSSPERRSENKISVLSGFPKVEALASESVRQSRKQTFLQSEIVTNPDCAFLISDDAAVSKAISAAEQTIGEIAHCVTGFYSGNDKQFLQVSNHEQRNGKNYQPVSVNRICHHYQTIQPSELLNGLDGERTFIPIVKGGAKKYLKPDVWYMNWSKEAVQHYKKDKKARFQNPHYYFRTGIGVPMISSSSISASLIEGKLFDQSIVGIFPKEECLTWYLLAFFNSPTCNKLIRTINPSANNPANYIKKIPFIPPNDAMLNDITRVTQHIVRSVAETGDYSKHDEKAIWARFLDLYGF